MAKKLNIGIIWADPYNKNMGVGALAYSGLALITDILMKKNIQFDISFIGSSEKQPGSLKINEQELVFNNLPGMNFFHWKSLIKLTLFPFRYKTFKLLKINYILDIGDGDSFTDIYSNQRFFSILNSKRFFSLLGKKQILMPQTVGPFKNPRFEKLAFSAMRKMNAVISRDKQSYDYTSRFLDEDKIAETIDVAFYLPFVKQKFDKNKTNIGINVSGLLWHQGNKTNNKFNLSSDYQNLIRRTIEYFINTPENEVHIVPHVVSNNKHFEDDCMVSEILKVEFPALRISPYFEDPIEAKSYISGLDFFIGARMHSCIAAFSTGVPVFPMAYSRKFNGLFSETLHYPALGDCVNQKEDVIFSNLKSAFENKNQLKKEIAQTNNTIVKERLQLLENIILKILNV